MSTVEGFSKAHALKLVGTRVIKRVFEFANPHIRPGDRGTVIEALQSKIADGYAVTVDWGDERWIYDTPERFYEDTRPA